jgi:hypothetical protein
LKESIKQTGARKRKEALQTIEKAEQRYSSRAQQEINSYS